MTDDQLGLFTGTSVRTESGQPMPDDVAAFFASGQQTSAHIDPATGIFPCTPHSVAPSRRRDVDARRQCPVCHAAPGQRCYQHCEANRPG